MRIPGSGSLRKGDLGLASLAVMLTQLLSNQQSTKDITEEIRTLRHDFQISQIDQEKNFAKKNDILEINSKLNSVTDQLKDIREQIKDISMVDIGDEEIVSCFYPNSEIPPTIGAI